MEDWNLQRTKEIVDLLGTRWGRVCQENVERCVRRIGGLDCLWEDGIGASDADGNKPRILSIAGNEILIEVEWIRDLVEKVNLSFPKPFGPTRTDEQGSEILRRDLAGWNNEQGKRYVPLKRFAENLQRLGRTDQLGRERVSAFEALHGVFHNLKALWDFELERDKIERANQLAIRSPELFVMTEKSGRPATHSNNAIGLRLDYWVEGRTMLSRTESSAEKGSSQASSAATERKCWTLQLGCEAFDANQYPPIRISNSWLADRIEGTIPADEALMTETTAFIDWQEPPPSFVPTAGGLPDPDAMQLDLSLATLPNVRFVAKLDPPVTLPLKTAVDIFNHVGQPIQQDAIESTTFADLLFAAKLQARSDTQSTAAKDKHLRFLRRVRTYLKDGTRPIKTYALNVFVAPDSWARTVHEIPFSHPRQLVEILPYLRQWAFFGRLLQRSVGMDAVEDQLDVETLNGSLTVVSNRGRDPVANGFRGSTQTANGHPPSPSRSLSIPSDTDDEDEEDVFQPAIKNLRNPVPNSLQRHSNPLAPFHFPQIDGEIDIMFITPALSPRIDLDILLALPERSTIYTRFHIMLNAEMEVESGAGEEDRMEGMQDGTVDSRETYLGVLKAAEDLGVLVAWLDTNGGKR